MQLELGSGPLADALQSALEQLQTSPHPEVDNLADWLLISQLQMGGQPPESPLAEFTDMGVTLRISKSAGNKCARCWPYETDIGTSSEHPEICGRCIESISH